MARVLNDLQQLINSEEFFKKHKEEINEVIDQIKGIYSAQSLKTEEIHDIETLANLEKYAAKSRKLELEHKNQLFDQSEEWRKV